VNGNTYSRTQNSDGSGSESFTTAEGTTATTVAVPVTADGTSTIPVVRTVTAKTAAATNYSAADWYPANGAPSSPLVLQTRTVVGPAPSLPAECNGALLQPDIYEIDTTTTDLNTIGATYSTTTTRAFNDANAVSVCQLSSEVSSSFDLLTGALVSTTTTATTTLLSTISQ
jgi:hypothetical protein